MEKTAGSGCRSLLMVCVVLCLQPRRWSVHTAVREPVPSLAGVDLIDVLAMSPDIRYSDWAKVSVDIFFFFFFLRSLNLFSWQTYFPITDRN